MAPDVGAGAGASAAEAVPTRDEATTTAAAAAARILAFNCPAAIFFGRTEELRKQRGKKLSARDRRCFDGWAAGEEASYIAACAAARVA